jgi:hypothetical protein
VCFCASFFPSEMIMFFVEKESEGKHRNRKEDGGGEDERR